jgi:signal transduction histidine kinase
MNPAPTRILIVDDEVGMREGCRRALRSGGYQIDTAEHGAEGLRKLRENAYDLVLLDAMMPGMSGLELLRHIQGRDPDTITIMITGYATVDLATQAMKQGAQSFLPKPFTSDELLHAVQAGLEERARRLNLRAQEARELEAAELVRTREERAKIDAVESRFMLVLVHELRNPAGVIKNYLQLMRAGYVDADEWDEYLGKLDGRATQLLAMLDDLLELAQLKEMQVPTRLQPVDAAAVLEEVAGRFRRLAEARGLSLELEILSRPILQATAAHVTSLWTRLIENAVAYTPSGGIKVSLSEENGWLTSSIADTGIGIATEDLGRIFQDFYRSEAAKAQVEFGTGLGLPIVCQVLAIYGGEILVDSAAGQGSIFTVRVPLKPPRP